MANETVANEEPNPPSAGFLTPDKSVAKSLDGIRVELWRKLNRDRYNARMREYMRKRRAPK